MYRFLICNEPLCGRYSITGRLGERCNSLNWGIWSNDREREPSGCSGILCMEPSLPEFLIPTCYVLGHSNCNTFMMGKTEDLYGFRTEISPNWQVVLVDPDLERYENHCENLKGYLTGLNSYNKKVLYKVCQKSIAKLLDSSFVSPISLGLPMQGARKL